MSSLDVILAGYSAAINDEDKLNNRLFEKGYEIASTKRTSARIGKHAPPARGTGKSNADEPASTDFKEGALGKVKGLIQVQEEQQANDALKIEGIQGELFPEEKKPSTNPRAQSARRKRNRQKGDAGEARENERRGGEQLKPEEIWPNYPNMLKINPGIIKEILQFIPALAGFQQMAGGPMLPGERDSTPGGLGNMNKDALERWIKENNMSGGAADKIRRKWKGLHGGIDLPLAQVDYSNIPNARDLQIRDAINKYGKDKDGNYKDPLMLIKTLPRA